MRRGLLALPALLMLAAAPVAATMPALHLVSMCTSAGARLVLVEGPDPTRPADERHPAMTGCAHALCPREILPDRKSRRRS